jgi:hypothetical protein
VPHSTRRIPLLAAAAVTHGALSLGWTRVLARLAKGPLAGAAARSGAGAVIAALDLGLARVIGGPRFGPIAELPLVLQIADHLAFGALAGWLLAMPPATSGGQAELGHPLVVTGRDPADERGDR